MRAIIDTSSFLALVRYYLPFDVDGSFYNYVMDKIASGQWIVIDAVLVQCSYTSGGLVLNELPFLSDKDFISQTKCIIKAESLIHPSPIKFMNKVNMWFAKGALKRKTPEEIESLKEVFIDDADCKIILYALINKGEDILVVTEETKSANDNKIFKKIPHICEMEQINVTTIAGLLEIENDINVGFGFD